MPPTQDKTPDHTVQVKVLNQEHPDRDAAALLRMRALAEGGDTWHDTGLKRYWLPQNAVEPNDVYANRLSLAVYENEVGPLLKQINAHLFTEPLSAQGLPDEPYWPRFVKDCDKNGTTISGLFSAVNEHALIGRRAFVWVNLPSRGGVAVANRADEESFGFLDAYLSLLSPEQVVNWGQADTNGPLSYVVIRDLVFEQDGPLSPRERKIRWTIIDQHRISRYVFVCKDNQEPGDLDTATLESTFEHRIGFCPVVMLELLPNLWIMRQVFDRAVGLLRASNNRAWALHQAANELLVLTEARTSEGGTPTLGHGHYLRLTRDESGSDEAAYVAPSGVAFDHLATLEQDKREGLYRALQSMASAGGTDSSRVTQSGESKALDWQAMDIVLASYSVLVKTCARKVLEFILRIRATTETKAATQIDTLSVDGLESWATEDLITFLESCALAVEAKRASPKFVQEVALLQARRILGDKVSPERMAEIEEEILDSESGDDAEQDAAVDEQDMQDEQDANTDPASQDAVDQGAAGEGEDTEDPESAP